METKLTGTAIPTSIEALPLEVFEIPTHAENVGRDWRIELEENKGRILLPNGLWARPSLPILRSWDGDVWSDPKEIIRTPAFEQEFAVFRKSTVQAGLSGISGDSGADFVIENTTFRAKGDLFDLKCIYVDREVSSQDLGKEDSGIEFSPSTLLGKVPRRTMNRLKGRIDQPRTTLAQGRLLDRMCLFSWAWKVFAARAGYAEFCERV